MDEQLGPPHFARTALHKLATARALAPSDVLLVVLAWGTIAAASLAIAILPSRRILRTLGPNLGAVTQAPSADARQQHRAWRIARAIGIAARYAPFRANCYPQALAAAQVCRSLRVPHAVHLGARFAAPDDARAGALQGHAWVGCEGVTICGGADSAHAFGTVACFVHTPRAGDVDAVA